MTTNMTQAALDEIRSLVPSCEVTFGGGGKGQTATLDDGRDGGETIGRGTSRYAALVDLLEQVRALWGDLSVTEEDRLAALAELDAMVEDGSYSPGEIQAALERIPEDEEPDPPIDAVPLLGDVRVTIDDAVAQVRIAFPEVDVNEEDVDRAPGPLWEDVDGVPVLISITPCVGECMVGKSDICDCRCGGANHGIMALGLLGSPTWADVKELRPVMLGRKECLCGCGGFTDRKFVPGHDARFHAAQKRAAAIEASGLAEDEWEVERIKLRRAGAAERRKAKKVVEAV